jgi:hypothetical protein
MIKICFQSTAFSTEPEGDLTYCNGMPGSQVANWIRGELVTKGYTCNEPLQEDYGWGFYLEADSCSIWVAISYGSSITENTASVPEWQVGVHGSSFPWQLRQWFRKRQRRDLEQKVYSIVQDVIASHPGVTVIER